MNIDVAKKDKFKALLGAVALALVVAVLAPPAVQAATQRVKGTVTSKLRDTGGGVINSKAIEAQGLFGAPGSSGALDVRTFGAGNGFLGAADCTATEADGLTNQVEAPGGSVITGILITGTNAQVTVTADAVNPALPLLTFITTADNPNEAFSLGNGLAATAPIKFTCGAPGGGDGNGRFVLIGQDN